MAEARLPVGTFTMNVTGSFVLGLLGVIFLGKLPEEHGPVPVAGHGPVRRLYYVFDVRMGDAATAPHAELLDGGGQRAGQRGGRTCRRRVARCTANGFTATCSAMKTESTALLLTMYIDSGDHRHGARSRRHNRPTFATAPGIAGATVFRVMEGYGSSGRSTTRLLELGENLPVRIEVIDARERIEALLPELDAMVPQGLMRPIVEVRTRR